MRLVSLLYVVAGIVTTLDGQVADLHRPVPPPGPLIQKRAPDFSRWTVDLKSSSKSQSLGDDSTQSQPSDPKSIIISTSVTKTGDIIRVDYTDTQKRVWTTWLNQGQEVVAWPDGRNIGFAAKPPLGMFNPVYVDFSTTDFPGFDWISASNYDGIRPVGGKSCLIFTFKLSNSGISSAVSAAIDLKTRLPVQMQNSSGVTTYEFQPTPSAMQTLPSNVQKLIVDQRIKEKSLARIPIAPY